MSQTENLFVLLILNAIELWGITDLQTRLSKFGISGQVCWSSLSELCIPADAVCLRS